jgi:hypothetical protein
MCQNIAESPIKERIIGGISSGKMIYLPINMLAVKRTLY